MRSQCSVVSAESNYRIQFNTTNGKLYFSYLGEGEELLTLPPADDEPDDDDGMEEGEVDDDDDDDDDDEDVRMDVEDEEEEIRVIKRPKLK